MKYAIIDTETTGLDPARSAILEIAIIVWEDGRRAERFHTKIKPTDAELSLAQRRALEINGYASRPQDWDDAPTFVEVAPEIARLLDGCTPVGHNVQFDIGMLRANLKRHGFRGRVPYPAIDTITLVMEHLFPLGLERASLDSVREFLRWSSVGAHTAAKDAEDTLALFRLLWRASWWTRLSIQLDRAMGGRVSL